MVGRTLVLAALILSLGCRGGATGPAAVVRVSAAVSLSDALLELARSYEEATGTRVELNLAGSDTLATQLLAGAPADLFISADAHQMERVQASGSVVAGTRVELLANQLAVVMPAEGGSMIQEPADLTSDEVRRIALGDPSAVPAGVYARRYLESIGLWSRLEAKVVPTRDVRAALAVVAQGDADAGIVYRTDLSRAAGVELAFVVPLDQTPPIRYPAALLVSGDTERGADFLTFLQQPAARRRFDDAGFIPLD